MFLNKDEQVLTRNVKHHNCLGKHHHHSDDVSQIEDVQTLMLAVEWIRQGHKSIEGSCDKVSLLIVSFIRENVGNQHGCEHQNVADKDGQDHFETNREVFFGLVVADLRQALHFEERKREHVAVEERRYIADNDLIDLTRGTRILLEGSLKTHGPWGRFLEKSIASELFCEEAVLNGVTRVHDRDHDCDEHNQQLNHEADGKYGSK